MSPSPPSLSQLGRGIATGLFVALVVGVVANPPAHSGLVRVLELIAIVVLGFVTLATVVALVISHIAGWQDSEQEFELKVRRSEELARDDLAWDPQESEFLALDPLIDADFEELVRDALDDLPDLLRNALDHVAVLMLLDRRPDVFLARRSGAEGWLVKPLDPLRLRRAVTSLLDDGTYTDDSYIPVPVLVGAGPQLEAGGEPTS